MSIRGPEEDGTYLVETYAGSRHARRTATTLKEAKGIEQELT